MYIGNDLRSGRAEVFYYTSTSGGETVVTTASDGRSIRYDVGYCNVYLNGVRLHDSDYAATTGTSITNLDALSQNDVLIVEAPSTFSSTNTVPASGGSFTGPLTIDGGINQKAAAQDLSGTYANERMYINDAYTLKGDVSITGHLALGSISSGDIVISEFIREPESSIGPHTMSVLMEDFGIKPSKLVELKSSEQYLGKIKPINEELRKQFIFEMTSKYGIYSLGRFATWRQILLDDVADDIQHIEKFIRSSSNYNRWMHSQKGENQ